MTDEVAEKTSLANGGAQEGSTKGAGDTSGGLAGSAGKQGGARAGVNLKGQQNPFNPYGPPASAKKPSQGTWVSPRSRKPTIHFSLTQREAGTGHSKKLGQATSEEKTEIAASIQTAFRDGLKALPKNKEFVEAVVNVVKNNLFENAVKTAVSEKSPANCPSKRVLNEAVKDNGATVDAIISKSLAPKLSAAVKAKPVWSYTILLL